MDNNKSKLLYQKIETLSLTAALKNILLDNNISTLKELLEIEVHSWHKKFQGFNYHHQHEIVSWLDENNMAEFLKED